jgi:uncharacterized protein YjbJ (UPF0337 family)
MSTPSLFRSRFPQIGAGELRGLCQWQRAIDRALATGRGARPRLADAARCRPTRDEWPLEGDRMGTDDKIDNKADELKGKVKEGVGDATGDRDLQAEGQADQAKGNLKQAGEKIKDAFKS